MKIELDEQEVKDIIAKSIGEAFGMEVQSIEIVAKYGSFDNCTVIINKNKPFIGQTLAVDNGDN
jgi:hypothetical protein